MKPRNFPERVNQRRKVALANLEFYRARYADDDYWDPRVDLEIATLQARIVPSARSIRTKHSRPARVAQSD